ncbi:MAG: response regulator [Candidatus Saccharimonadales bacterium]
MTKILLVEDDKSLREIYGVRLLAEGYDIVSAGDGEAALAMAIKERPQLIVSDVMMPKISGFDMLDILRSTTETKDIKVIMMTALSSEDQRARGEALGADRYLVKSQVGIEDVVRTVHDVLGDAPISHPSAQAFGAAPAPTAMRPAPAPATTQAPQPAPVSPQPVQQFAPAPTPQPVAAAPAPAPTFSPVSQPTPVVNSLPQPTAPFSTARPANLGERVIHPITPDVAVQDMAALISQELNNATPTPQPVAAAPAPAPTFSPVSQPTPVAPPQMQQPVQQQPSPQPVSAAPAAVAQTPQLPGIQFEETPRPTPPTIPSPFGAQPPQQ